MAKIPLPERGQPLDVTYIYQLADAVNDLSTQISSATNNYTSVKISDNETSNLKTSDVKIIAEIKEVKNASQVNSGNEQEFTIPFSNFKYPPVVTATPINTTGTAAGQSVSVVLKSITTTGVTGIVKFGASGEVSIKVHVIAVGVPN